MSKRFDEPFIYHYIVLPGFSLGQNMKLRTIIKFLFSSFFVTARYTWYVYLVIVNFMFMCKCCDNKKRSFWVFATPAGYDVVWKSFCSESYLLKGEEFCVKSSPKKSSPYEHILCIASDVVIQLYLCF